MTYPFVVNLITSMHLLSLSVLASVVCRKVLQECNLQQIQINKKQRYEDIIIIFFVCRVRCGVNSRQQRVCVYGALRGKVPLNA